VPPLANRTPVLAPQPGRRGLPMRVAWSWQQPTRPSSAVPGPGRNNRTRPAADSPGPMEGRKARLSPRRIPQAQGQRIALGLLIAARPEVRGCVASYNRHGFDPGQQKLGRCWCTTPKIKAWLRRTLLRAQPNENSAKRTARTLVRCGTAGQPNELGQSNQSVSRAYCVPRNARTANQEA